MKKIALFPGSFDPFTKGHQDIVLRATSIFDEIVIGIGHNSQKQRYFPIEMMIECIKKSFDHAPNIRVETFVGLTASFAQNLGAKYLLRGLRNTTDFEYENSIAQVNKNIYPELETVLLITSPELAYISSTLVRDIHKYGQNVEKYLPYQLPT
jgi:pantetheine-phosphate adenylyltransferase